jgi:hypothetical protein
MQEERWADIPGFPNYMVSDHGRVRNIKHERLVKPSLTSQGAVKVNLYDGHSRVTKSVKVLVASLFLDGRTEQFDTAMHLDGDQTNNRLDNLVWRPRWFAWKYSRQFKHIDYFITMGAVYDVKSETVYDTIVDAGVKNGLLFDEINFGIVNNVVIFPTWQLFEWY